LNEGGKNFKLTKPNIIMILVDDMGWRDLGCYGSGFYETPCVDRLAAEGVRFTDAYATCPVCSPSRASVMTGKYPVSVGITDWINYWLKDGERDFERRGRLMDVPYLKFLPLAEKTIASALRDGGYATWHVGKWHLGGENYYPERHGFDVNVGGSFHGCPPAGYFSPYNLPNLVDGPEGEFLTDRLTDEAIKLIKDHCNKGDGRPFFLNLCHYAVHTPITGKRGDVERFIKKSERLNLNKINPLVEGEPFPTEHKKHLRVTRRVVQSSPEYAALVFNLDQNVGRLSDALAETGMDKNTLVVFTSDNGGLSTAEGSPTCNIPLAEGKGWMYDGGVRVPLIIKWPGKIEPGSVSREIVTSADFYPTFLDAAGLAPMPERHIDGINIMPALAERKPLGREAVFWHYPHYANQGGTPGCAVRSGDYKLIEFFEDGRLELYDLEEDISESRNLASELPEVRERLFELLSDWKNKKGARIPAPNPDYNC